jgi:hypothetical protein
VTTNGIPGSVVAGLNAHADALVEGVTYTSALPVLGGQATLVPARSSAPLRAWRSALVRSSDSCFRSAICRVI